MVLFEAIRIDIGCPGEKKRRKQDLTFYCYDVSQDFRQHGHDRQDRQEPFCFYTHDYSNLNIIPLAKGIAAGAEQLIAKN